MQDQIVAFLRSGVAEELGLSQDEVAINTDFEDLGMTSLNAVMLSGRIEDEFNVELEPSLVFENRTIAALAEAIAPIIEAAGR